MKNSFGHYHPAAVFLYISFAIVSAMVTYTPHFVAVSLVCACTTSIYLNGGRRFLRGLRILIPLLLLLLIITPITNHRGRTVLFEIITGSVTLEALVYGISMGGMLVSVFIWFQCYQTLITNDKFMFLFARIAPTSAMVVSMITKFIPVTSQKLRGIRDARKAISGTGSSSGTIYSEEKDDKNKTKEKSGKMKLIKNGINTVSILMSRCLEDSIETADSMRARGYGTCKRTVFAAPQLRSHDIISICFCSGLFVFFMQSILMPEVKPTFFPILKFGRIDPLVLLLYATMLMWPLLIGIKDGLFYYVRCR